MEKRALFTVHYWWEYKFIQPLWRTEQAFLKKLKTELSYDPAISLVGIFPKKSVEMVIHIFKYIDLYIFPLPKKKEN